LKVLKKVENLGRYGEIIDITVKENMNLDRRKFMVRYKEEFHAALAFKGINLLKTKGSPLRAYYSKNKYCLHYVRGDNCRKYNCPFIHSDYDVARYFFENETNASYFEDNMARVILFENRKETLEFINSLDSYQSTSLFLSPQDVLVSLENEEQIENRGECEEEELNEPQFRRNLSERKDKSHNNTLDEDYNTVPEEEDSETNITEFGLLVGGSGINPYNSLVSVGRRLALDEYIELHQVINDWRKGTNSSDHNISNSLSSSNLPDAEDVIQQNNDFLNSGLNISSTRSHTGSDSKKETYNECQGRVRSLSSQNSINSGYNFECRNFWLIQDEPEEAFEPLESQICWSKLTGNVDDSNDRQSGESKRKRKKKKIISPSIFASDYHYYLNGSFETELIEGQENCLMNELEVKLDKNVAEKQSKNSIDSQPTEDAAKNKESLVSEEALKFQENIRRQKEMSDLILPSALTLPNTKGNSLQIESENVFEAYMDEDKKSRAKDSHTDKKSKKKKALKIIVENESQMPSLFDGKAARRQKKNQKKKKKKQQHVDNQKNSEMLSSRKSINSINCSSIAKKEDLEKSEVSEMETINIILPDDSDSQNFEVQKPPLRKQSEHLSEKQIQKQEHQTPPKINFKKKAQQETPAPAEVVEKESTSKQSEIDQKKKKKKKKKNNTKHSVAEKSQLKQEESQIVTDKSVEMSNVLFEKDPLPAEIPANIKEKQEYAEFAREDDLDMIADSVCEISIKEGAEPLECILSILDQHIWVHSQGAVKDSMKSSYEIFVESNEDSLKIAFLGDGRRIAVNQMQEAIKESKLH